MKRFLTALSMTGTPAPPLVAKPSNRSKAELGVANLFVAPSKKELAKILEKYFREKLIEQGGITKIGGYWDKTGKNEINLIALNETEKKRKSLK
jgi:hypothetical protein